MSDKVLIATLDVAALVVSQADVNAQSLALPAMADFSSLSPGQNPAPYISQSVLGGSAPFVDGEVLSLGVHLHWSLPRQLTRGHVKSDGKGLAFPGVPDRWLVTRFLVKGDEPAQARSWVVESDRLNDDPVKQTGPRQPNILYQERGQPARVAWIGQVFAAEGWSENPEIRRAPRPFTALGYGDPSFAAFYPSCSSVFGFHDELEDVEDGDGISYLVSGWYARDSEDPLHAATDEVLADWQVPDGSKPEQLVCSGMVDGIVWIPAERYLDDPAQPLTVAIAGTSREALSALLAKDAGSANAEQLLNALQFGLLAGADDHAASDRDFEQALHDAGFASLSAGSSWTVERRDDKAAADASAELPAGQASELASLNNLQNTQNAEERQLESRQTQLFHDWQKYQRLAYEPALQGTALHGRLDELRGLLMAQAATITDEMAAVARGRAAIEQAAQRLSGQLVATLELHELTAAPRFYQPAEPVLLLAGQDVQPPQRHAPDRLREKEPRCRLASSILFLKPMNHLYQAYVLTQRSLPVSLKLRPILCDLIVEALGISPLLNPAWGPFPIRLHGDYPGAGYCQDWNTPWLPFLLHYEVTLSPLARASAQAPFPEGFIRDNFRFAFDALDLAPGAGDPGVDRTYQESTLLAADATLGLAREIERYQAQLTNTDTNLRDLLAKLGQLPLLAQNLTGFNDALLMQRAALQLAVDDPWDAGIHGDLIDAVRVAVGNQKRLNPLPLESFNPLRAERLRLGKLRLVDVFGRYKDYLQPDVLVARGLQPSGTPVPAGDVLLAPRITQPARLQFRWRAAAQPAQESQDVVDNGPILGWVMPNHLAHSLMIHAANGQPLGELALSGEQVRWTCAPLGAFAFGTSMETVFAGQPADLGNLVSSLYNDGDASQLKVFLHKVGFALQFCLPDRFAETAEHVVLSGQPLVLARASLSLELAGLSAQNQSWASLEQALPPKKSRDDAGLGDVRFPIRLGALNKLDDTLVGYWIDPKDAAAYRNFQAPYSVASELGNASLPLKDEPISLAPAEPPQELVLLLDPRGSVHASSGILPVKTIDIPPRHYVKALASFTVTFDCLPVLTSAPLSMVLPKVYAGEWQWVTTDGESWHSQVPGEISAAKASLDFGPQRISEGWLRVRRDGQEKPGGE